MSYKKRSIELLNKAVGDELAATHQYMYYHFVLEDAGYGPMSKLFHRIGIVEMMHVEQLAERILFLGGEVEMKVSTGVKYNRDPKDILKHAVQMESGSVESYNTWAKECGDNKDAVSKQVFETLVGVEEEHQDIFETEMNNIVKFGDTFLALQLMEKSKEVAGGGTGGV